MSVITAQIIFQNQFCEMLNRMDGSVLDKRY